jgi:heat shock protein HtpX
MAEEPEASFQSLDPCTFADEISANKRKTVLIVAFMFALLWGVVFVAGWAFGYPPIFTGILAAVIGGGYVFFTYRQSVQTVLDATEAREVNRDVRAERLLENKVEEMAIAAQLPKPAVYVQESEDPNAFAAGKSPEDAVVCVTTGGLEIWDHAELEGVIAHEMAHVLNRDVLLQTVTVGVVGAIAMLSEILLRGLLFSGGRGGKGGRGGVIAIVVGVLALILAPIVSRMTYLAMSRNREYLADATAVRLTRNSEGLAQALEKLRDDAPDDPQGSKTVASLYLGNPFERNVDASNLFSTHPPLNKRIRRIRCMA